MALASRLSGPPAHPNRRGACSVSKFADTIPTQDGEALLAAVAADSWPLTQLIEAVREEYPTLAIPHYSTFQRHRTLRCACTGVS